MKFRIYCVDLHRWFEMIVYDVENTTIEDVKKQLFMQTGMRPHYQRLWYGGNALRNDFRCRDLPFQPTLRHGDAGLLLTTFIAVDDASEGFSCEMNEESPEAARRYSKPEMYPKAKTLMLTEWSMETFESKYTLLKLKTAEARRQNAEAEQKANQLKFRGSQLLVQGAMERNARSAEVREQRGAKVKEADENIKRVHLYYQDLTRYLLLLVFFQLALALGPNGDPTKFDVVKSFKQAYTDPLATVNSHKTFWEYMQGQFVNTTVADEFYNGTQLPPNKLGFTMGANYIVGPVQMRQVRSKVDTCLVPIKNLRTIPHCYPPFVETLQDDRPFGPTHQYQYFVVEGGTALKGRLAYPYPDIGYAVKIPKTATEARVLLASMKKNRWLDHQSRAVLVQWTIYNPDVDLFINSQLLFELPSFGGLYTKAKFLALQPIRYFGASMFVLGLEIIVIIVVLAALHREFTLVKC